MKSIELEILTPAKRVAQLNAYHVRTPGLMGEIGLLPDHANMIAELGPGELSVDLDTSLKQDHSYFVAGGYVEVDGSNVNIVADAVEACKEIDLERASRSEQRALERIKTGGTEVDLERAQRSLKRAQARKQFVARHGK